MYLIFFSHSLRKESEGAGNVFSLEIHRKCLVMQGKKPGEKENERTASVPRNIRSNVDCGAFLQLVSSVL